MKSKISHNFGRCPYYVFVDVEGEIAGGMGLRALEWFKRLNIKPITGVEGSVEEILKLYLRGELGEAAPCTEKSGEACN
ncbi:MAG: NifB/NifX family molybdenum-iron cluster-binding protein [Candidatus Verstraetearchaeota archaeon]|nr:NifB/NifX family molybdenum-iron cluster-binding protein [Candidatus Verstraetearchaeota archaeon]